MPLKILHNLWFSFLLGITAVPRGIENNAMHIKLTGARGWTRDGASPYKTLLTIPLPLGTDTRKIRTPWHVPLVSSLTGVPWKQ